MSPFIIIEITPKKQKASPNNCILFNFSLKKNAEIKIMNIGDDV